jgi:RNA polymerase sigma factor (sigma-70 family)
MDLTLSTMDRSEERYPDQLSDEELVADAKMGSLPAFEGLWGRHSKRAYTLLYRITKNREDAEDALQEGFLRAFIHVGSFDGRAAFSTWVTRIAINAALMNLRKKRTRNETQFEWSTCGETWTREPVDHRQNIEELCTKKEQLQQLERAIIGLNPDLRQMIELQRLKNASVAELAKVIGVSKAAAKSRLYRARRRLRQSLRR